MENKNYLKIIIIAGAFVSFLVGAGTATGQEILQFFTSFGYLGIGAIIITMILHAWFGAYLMDIGHRLQPENSGDVYRYICGKYLGTFFEWFAQMFIFIIFVVMISGAGATLTEYYGLNIVVGRMIMASLALFTVLMGLNKMVKILGLIGPVIIGLVLLIGGTSFITNFDGFLQAGQIIKTIDVPKATSSWIYSGFVYAAFVVLAAVPFLSSIGKNETNRKNVILGGVLGGVSVVAAVLVINLGILSNIEIAYTKDIPTLFLADQISPIFGIFFSIVLLAGIYSTATPMLWTVADHLSKKNEKKFRIIAVIIAIIGFLGGLLPFGQLIGTIYPYTGYMGMLIFVGMFYRQFINPGVLKNSVPLNSESDKKSS